jgi:hypothetical protein
MKKRWSDPLSVCGLVLGLLCLWPSPSGAKENITQKDIDEVLKRNALDIRNCYQTYAGTQPTATGHVTLKMEVGTDGMVIEGTVEVNAPGVKGPAFEECIIELFGFAEEANEKKKRENKIKRKKWQFPETENETVVECPLLYLNTRVPGAGPSKK